MTADPEWLEKIRSVGAISRRSGDRVDEGRDAHGRRVKAVTDELNNTVVQRNDGTQDVQDVVIRAPHLRQVTTLTEER